MKRNVCEFNVPVFPSAICEHKDLMPSTIGKHTHILTILNCEAQGKKVPCCYTDKTSDVHVVPLQILHSLTTNTVGWRRWLHCSSICSGRMRIWVWHCDSVTPAIGMGAGMWEICMVILWSLQGRQYSELVSAKLLTATKKKVDID